MKYSLAHKILYYIILILFLNFTVLIITNIFSIKAAMREVQQSYSNSLDMLTDDIDTELSNVARFLISFSEQTETKQFCYLQDEEYFIKSRLQDDLFNALYSQNYISGMWIYSNVIDRNLWVREDSHGNFNDYLAIIEEFENKDNIEKYVNGCWQVAKIGDCDYFVYVVYNTGICYGAWVNVENIMESAMDYFDENNLALTVSNNDKILEPILFEDKMFQVEDPNIIIETEEKRLEWQYLIIESALEVIENIRFNLIITQTFINNTTLIIGGLFILGIISIILIVVIYYNIKTHLLYPVKDIVGSIGKMGDGDLEQTINTSKYTVELKEIGDTLNKMYHEVKELKIRVYEEELEKKDAQLQFYNAQIRPHFILNVINTIYSMASIKENENILKTCRYLSRYMRYMFSEKTVICTIEEEISHLQEYILLQEVRYPKFLVCRLELEPQILPCYIPTLSLHSLVENIFKYGIFEQEELKIWIKGTLLIDTNQVKLTVIDNGPGFEEHVIEKINGNQFEEEYTHIGISNTMFRFREMYQDKFKICVKNSNGAQIELCFPFKSKS